MNPPNSLSLLHPHHPQPLNHDNNHHHTLSSPNLHLPSPISRHLVLLNRACSYSCFHSNRIFSQHSSLPDRRSLRVARIVICTLQGVPSNSTLFTPPHGHTNTHSTGPIACRGHECMTDRSSPPHFDPSWPFHHTLHIRLLING